MRVVRISFILVILLLSSVISSFNVLASDELVKEDFDKASFSKTIDVFDYARKHAEATNGTVPPSAWESNIVVNYINEKGLKLLYMGFAGVDFGEAEFQMPLQSIVERFKTPSGDEAMTASTFLMLMAFNDTATSKYPGSPDEGDNIWASFSMGADFSELNLQGTPPKLQSSVEVTPLTSSADRNEWTWGMKYKDMAAIWWQISGKSFLPIPVSFSIYDELSFNYRLVINPSDGKASLYMTYTIGKMRDLWVLGHLFIFPTITHFNASGTYNARDQKVSSLTIHDFLEQNKISMSIVSAQRTWIANKATLNKFNGVAPAAGTDVSKGTIQTVTADGSSVFDVSFGSKKTYNLVKPSGSSTYDAVTRTADVNHYSKNPVLIIQSSLLWGANAVLANMFPVQYAQEAKSWMNATKSDYLYATSYPTYGGYKVVHDPVYTAYIPPVKTSGGVPIPDAALFIGVGLALVILIERRLRTI